MAIEATTMAATAMATAATEITKAPTAMYTTIDVTDGGAEIYEGVSLITAQQAGHKVHAQGHCVHVLRNGRLWLLMEGRIKPGVYIRQGQHATSGGIGAERGKAKAAITSTAATTATATTAIITFMLHFCFLPIHGIAQSQSSNTVATGVIAAITTPIATPPIATSPVVLFTPVVHWHNVEGWTVSIGGGYPNQTLSRAQILLAAPGVRAYPNILAQDVLSRTAARQPASWAAQVWGTAAPAASAYLTTSGVLNKKNYQTYSGAGLALLQLGVALWAKSAVNVSPYFADLLPDRVVLDQSGSGEWAVVTGWDKAVPHPKAIGPYPIQIGSGSGNGNGSGR